MSLMERMSKAGTIKSGSLTNSSLFNEKDMIPTEIPIMNIALSGKLDGGLVPGLTLVAGPSKHFKSLMSLIMVKAYMDKYPDAICLFYDSEFGITPEYISSQGIDGDRIVHIPIEHIEQLKFDLSKRLEEIKREDHVVIFIDSVGNLASKKEVEDALDEKSVADMTRAKAIKSLFRIITPTLTTKDIPCIVVNHVYMEQGMYPKAIVSGGTGIYYSASTIWIIGRSQEKEGTEIVGYNFTINIEKSRYVKEKSKCIISVTFDGGLNKYSGLMDIALETGHCSKPKNGWYCRTGEDRNWRFNDTNCKEFWQPILLDKTFHAAVKQKFQLGTAALMQDEKLIDKETGEIL